jgi:hypothetical protein
MATTDARSGFRLPWSSDRPTDGSDESGTDNATAESAWSTDDTAPAESGMDAATATAETETAPEAAVEAPAAPVAETPAPAPAPASPKKPNKFLADLTKAMQAAAEDARGRSLTQLQADAKTHVESIHGRSATEAADLRKTADDDVAAIREWSKAEIARIREETDQKITDRKSRLETEIEQHAAVIEREIEAVQGTVGAFEAQMAAFFERLLGEEDPTRFATMAENLPEPPTFEDLSAMIGAPVDREPAEAVAVADEPVEAVETVEAPTDEVETTEAPETGEAETVDETAGEISEPIAEDVTEGVAETGEAESTESTETQEVAESTETSEGAEEGVEMGFVDAGDGSEGEGDGEVDREAAFAAIQAAAEAAASAEVAADAAARAEAVADVAIEIIGNHEGEPESEADPRFAALGLSPDYDAAEAEALAAADTPEGDEIPTIGDDALAARLAGLVPSKGKSGSGDALATQVIVTGLVSVASIASFKRHLGRVSGVQSVGVSSGPDGEFVFAVTHTADTNLRDVVPSLPSFQARVTSSSDGVVHVTAHDPEADA